MNLRIHIAKYNRHVLFLPIVLELVYFGFSFAIMPPLLKTVIAFPALFIIPGVMLLAILEKRICDASELFVQGFFVSTILQVALTAFFLALALAPTQFTYSVATLVLVSFLTTIGLVKKTEIRPRKTDVLFIALALSAYVILLLFFSTLPRLFTPDETSYISAARMGALNGVAPPMGVLPNRNEITAVLQGRNFWIYLITSFITTTGLPPYQAGLLGIGFIVMTAVASSLLVKNKWLSIAAFVLVVINPLLFSFSALILNDLALAFYAVLAGLYFIKSFKSVGNNVSISIPSVIFSALSLIVMALIKENLVIVFAIWIILVYVILKYQLYKQERKYKVLLAITLIPISVYELCVDIPYVVSVWMLRNRELGNTFGRFLVVSPFETLMRMFKAPWWNSNASTIFAFKPTDYLEHFYTLLTPESSTIVVSAIVAAVPLILWKYKRQVLQTNVLASLSVISLCAIYLQSFSSFGFGDVTRYSLWLTPLWISLTLTLIYEIVESKSTRELFVIQIMMLIIIWINLQITKEKGGVYVGYGLSSRLWTIDFLLIQIASIALVFGLAIAEKESFKFRLFPSRRGFIDKIIVSKQIWILLLVILVVASNVYFARQFTNSNNLYRDYRFVETNSALNEITNSQSLIFANNYIYMRPYVSDEIFRNGLILPPPETEDEFLNLVNTAPSNTIFLVSNNTRTAWYEYANSYLSNFTNTGVITRDKPNVASLSRFDLSNDILHMTFDNADNITVPDGSSSENDGINNGAQPVEGYSGKALHFSGTGYVAIPNQDKLNFHNALTVNLMALIKQADPQKGYTIISKGYAPMNGSFDIFIWNTRIYFELGQIGYIDFPAQKYLGEWHNFIFTYNGEEMEALVDGASVAAKAASGFILSSTYDLEIGRDGERRTCYFNGTIDELQISNSPLNYTALAENSLEHYALKTHALNGARWENVFFKTVNRDNSTVEASVHVDSVKITMNNDFSIILSLKMTSNIATNVTLLTSTDRFTKVYTMNLMSGNNNFTFEYPYVTNSSWSEVGGYYWRHLTQARVTIIANKAVTYSSFISIPNLPLTNFYLLLIVGILLATYLFVVYANRRYGSSQLNDKRDVAFKLTGESVC